MKKESRNPQPTNVFPNRLKQTANIFVIIFLVMFSLDFSTLFVANKSFYRSFSIAPTAKANHVYYNFTGGNLTLNITPATSSMITRNDDWTGVFAVEGFCGTGLTNTHGVDPQTVLGTGQTNNALPTSQCVNANKQNPSAFNTGGVTEFDAGVHLGIGFQGNVQANPYLVFYLNTTGQTKVFMSYDVSDIDAGTNDSVSQVALQYRVGDTGSFINIPEGFVADATRGPNDATLKATIGVYLPAGALNQPVVQVRLISTNAAAPDGTSTPDEWIGINNIVVTNQTTTAASVSVAGRALTPYGRPISRALVSMTDSMGNTRSAVTNPFGYYRFDDVRVGEGYVFTIYSKRYVFTEPTQFRLIDGEDDSVNFLAQY